MNTNKKTLYIWDKLNSKNGTFLQSELDEKEGEESMVISISEIKDMLKKAKMIAKKVNGNTKDATIIFSHDTRHMRVAGTSTIYSTIVEDNTYGVDEKGQLYRKGGN